MRPQVKTNLRQRKKMMALVKIYSKAKEKRKRRKKDSGKVSI